MMSRFGSLILLIAGLSCSGSISFIAGNSYWRERSIRSGPVNVLTKRHEVNLVQVEGLYHSTVPAINRPALFYVSAHGQLVYLPLSAELDCGQGDWIKAVGRTASHHLLSAHEQQYEIMVFQVDSYRIIQPAHHLLRKIQADYHRQRSKLEQVFRKEGSKLALPDEPDWLLVLDSANQRLVATLSLADLLYAGQIDLVYDLDQTLSAIYADHWFKGE